MLAVLPPENTSFGTHIHEVLLESGREAEREGGRSEREAGREKEKNPEIPTRRLQSHSVPGRALSFALQWLYAGPCWQSRTTDTPEKAHRRKEFARTHSTLRSVIGETESLPVEPLVSQSFPHLRK